MNKLKLKTTVLLIVFILGKNHINAQDSTNVNPLKISGYIEAYYSYDIGNPENHTRPAFFYSYNRHNETNLNLGFLKAGYNTDKIRGNFALMAGTYPQYNLVGELGLLRNIFEANVGVKVSKKNNLWIDAGIMPSHIGFESAIGKDCWNLTRSILADNSPYYESGIKLSYTTKNEKLYLAAMYLNGWQRIQRTPGNQTPSFGTQLTYKSNSKIILNWSTYVGNEKPDTLMEWRYFNNFYCQLQLTKKFGVIAGFDIGMQQQKKNVSLYNTWYSPVIIFQFKPTEKIRIAARSEYYSDENEVIIVTGTKNGFQTMGYSLNFDYLPTDNLIFRIEGRALNSIDKVFIKNNKPGNENYFVTGSIAISF